MSQLQKETPKQNDQEYDQGPQSRSSPRILSSTDAESLKSEMKETIFSKMKKIASSKADNLSALDRSVQKVIAQHEQRLQELEAKITGNDYGSGHHAVEKGADAPAQTANANALDYAPKEVEEKNNVTLEALLQRVDEVEKRQRRSEEEDKELQKTNQALEEARKSAEKTLEDGVSLKLNDIEEHSLGYTVEESVWDTVIFIGLDCVPTIDQIVAITGILINISIQIAFIMVVFANYSMHSFPEDMLDGLLHWRAVVAHDIANWDPASRTSLAARVCENEVSTDKSALQMELYDDLHSFRFSRIGPFGFLNGYFLCNMALLLWLFDILLEHTTNLKFTCAMLMHPRGNASIRQYGEDDIRILSFSTRQIVLAIFLVTIPRFIVAMLLGCAGTLFLCFTHNVNDLLLNSVALVFVLDIDEELYQSLAPRRIRAIVPLLAPVRNPHLDDTAKRIRTIRHWLERKAVRVVLVTLGIFLTNIWIMAPFSAKLDKAMSYMCSGNKDVLFMTNQVSGLVMYADSPEYEVKEAHKMTYQKRAVLEIIGMDPEFFKDKVIDLPDGDNYKNSSVGLSLRSLSRKAEGSRLYVSGTSMCIDHTDAEQVASAYPGGKGMEYYQATELQMRDLLKMPSFTSCHEMEFAKNCLGSSVARALCSRYCGCDNPWTGQFFATGSSGCPVNCGPRWTLAAFYQVPSNIATFTDLCEDVPAALLVKQDFWKNYVTGLKNHMLMFEPQPYVKSVVEKLLTKGCGYLTKLRFSVDVCEPNELHRSARLFCPATCMCASSDMKECPSSCTYTMTHQMMSPGVPCPLGLEISSAHECELAAEEILMRPKYIDDYHENTGGCFLSHGNLYWTNGSVHNTIPSDYIVLCKEAQPFLPNEISKGQFIYGKQCAECILNGSACAEDCYYTHSVPYSNTGSLL